MRLWTCNDFKGFWPVGTAAVAVAADKEMAREVLDRAIKERGLKDGLKADDEVIEMPFVAGATRILADGNY